jgi:predicted RNA-binding protein with PIN domain
VWGEASITVAVTDDPPQFVKVTFGHERLASNDSEQEILKTERQIHATNSKVVERRARELRQLVHRTMDEGDYG